MPKDLVALNLKLVHWKAFWELAEGRGLESVCWSSTEKLDGLFQCDSVLISDCSWCCEKLSRLFVP